MRRREFIALCSCVAVLPIAWPARPSAQQVVGPARMDSLLSAKISTARHLMRSATRCVGWVRSRGKHT